MSILFISLISQTTWAKAYGGGGTFSDWVRCLIQTPDGGFLIGGGRSSAQGVLIKTNSDGSVQWAKISSDWISPVTSVIRTSDGGYAGTMCYGEGGNACSDVFKFNSSGGLVWGKNIWWGSEIVLWDIVQTPDNGYATIGSGLSNSPILLKINSTGGLQWARSITLSGSGWNFGRSLLVTPDNGLLIVGEKCSEEDLFLLKMNSSYAIQWARRVDLPWDCRFAWSANILTQTADGGFAITAMVYDGDYDVLVMKFDASGNIVWAKVLEMGAWWDWGFSIVQTTDGGYAVGGATGPNQVGSSPAMLKLDADGNLIWARVYSGTEVEIACSMIQTTDGGYATVACMSASGSGEPIVFLKLDSDGYLENSDCVYEITPSVTDVTSSVSLTALSASLTAENLDTYEDWWYIPGSWNPPVAPICEPLYEKEDAGPGQREDITCSPVPGGLLFISPTEIPVSIYSAEGRLAYSGSLKRGETRVPLEQGVYFWITRNQKGKAVVR